MAILKVVQNLYDEHYKVACNTMVICNSTFPDICDEYSVMNTSDKQFNHIKIFKTFDECCID